MATKYWRGDAVAVAEVQKLTPANVEVGDIFSAIINGKTVSFTATAATVANVTDGLTTAWNASTIPEFAEITAVDATTEITLTHGTEGVPFTVTATAVNGGGTDDQTLTPASVTAGTGPNYFDDGDNWADVNGAVSTAPANSDVLIFGNNSVSCTYGLSTSLTGLTIHVKQSYTGTIGLPRNNSNSYGEYRTHYLTIDGGTLYIGEGQGNGSGRIKIATGSTATTLLVHNTGTAAEGAGVPSLLWQGTDSTNAAVIDKGHVGLGFFGETTALATLSIGHKRSQLGDATVYGGDACIIGTSFTMAGGRVFLKGITYAMFQYGGELTLEEDLVNTTPLKVYGGTCFLNTTGALADVEIMQHGVLDARQSMITRSAYNSIILHKGATVWDPYGKITFSGSYGYKTTECSLADVNLHGPADKTWAPS